MADGDNAAKTAGGGGQRLANLLQIVFVILNLSVLGGGSFLVYNSTIGVESSSVHETNEYAQMLASRETASAHPVIHAMDPFVINLAGTPRRTIRIGVSLELLNDEGFEEVINLGAGARDAVVGILNNKNFSEIETIQGKLFLKDQIASTLNHYLKRGVVTDVYFAEFVVQ
jgi:flagellar FliL protein